MIQWVWRSKGVCVGMKSETVGLIGLGIGLETDLGISLEIGLGIGLG